jgi:hypothetical protein
VIGDSDRFVTSRDSREGEISGSDRFVAATDSLQFSSGESESVVFRAIRGVEYIDGCSHWWQQRSTITRDFFLAGPYSPELTRLF